MEELLNLINLIDKSGGESSTASSIRSTDPLEFHRLLCLAASSFTLWLQPPTSITNKRKGKVVLTKEESAQPINHHKRRRLANDHHNNRMLTINSQSIGLSLGVSSVSTTQPAHGDDQLDHRKRENQATKGDDDNTLLRLSVGVSSSNVQQYHDQIRPVVHRSDPALFNIKKKLTPSDVGSLCRVLLPKERIGRHILPKLDEDLVDKIENSEGLLVTVLDEDRQEEYELTLKHLPSNSYYFNGLWTQDFVKSLNLHKDDEIGLYLDTTTPSPKPKFHFSLLKLADHADKGY